MFLIRMERRNSPKKARMQENIKDDKMRRGRRQNQRLKEIATPLARKTRMRKDLEMWSQKNRCVRMNMQPEHVQFA
jgi:hypothetical protein